MKKRTTSLAPSRKYILVEGVSSARLPVEGLRLGKVRLQQRLWGVLW